jgi:hypothetical protein
MRPAQPFAAVAILFLSALAASAQDKACLTMHDLRQMSLCELEALFRSAEIGTPPVGSGRGRLLCSTDPRHPRLKVLCSNAIWKGKVAEPDGHFTNRWLGGIRAIDSQYTIGPSWVDGRPAVLMEYAPGTPLLANTHDELREVAPGLYLGPLYDRCPCPVLRGYLAVEFADCSISCRPLPVR